MTRSSGLSPTREGLLNTHWGNSPRQFHDEAHRSSSDLDRQFDELELHDKRSKSSIFARWAQRWFGSYYASEQGYTDRKDTGRGRLAGKDRERGCCSRYKICFITTGLLLGLFLILSGSGVFWVYKSSPKDGVSAAQLGPDHHANRHCSNRRLGTHHLWVALSGHGRKATKKLLLWWKK